MLKANGGSGTVKIFGCPGEESGSGKAYDDRSLVPYRLDLPDDMTGSLPSGSCHKVHQILLKRQLLDGRFPSLLHSLFQSLQHLSLLQNHASLKIQHVLRCFYTRENLVPESPIPHPPSGCPFRTRCPYANEKCANEMPKMKEINGRKVACHMVG